LKNLDLSPFPKVDKATWNDLAKNQLKGEDPNEILSWQPFDGFSMGAYYDSSDIQGLDQQIEFFQSLPNHTWKLYEEISVINEKEANSKAIDALMGGCNGIIFNLKLIPITEELIKGIDSGICDLSFINSIDNQSIAPSKSYGMNNENCLFESKQHTSPVFHIEEFISSINHEFIFRTAFSDFFLEIATIRAIRYLLNVKLNKPDTKIHTCISAHAQDDHQWFLNTTAGLASILGGSHSVSFTTSKGDSRISRNVGNLIREESGIVEYQDQCGGSYYLEVLTNRLIEETLKRVKL
jgi:methylmalonyl-CoA mutase